MRFWTLQTKITETQEKIKSVSYTSKLQSTEFQIPTFLSESFLSSSMMLQNEKKLRRYENVPAIRGYKVPFLQSVHHWLMFLKCCPYVLCIYITFNSLFLLQILTCVLFETFEYCGERCMGEEVRAPQKEEEANRNLKNKCY